MAKWVPPTDDEYERSQTEAEEIPYLTLDKNMVLY
jgi:hypothetical protein